MAKAQSPWSSLLSGLPPAVIGPGMFGAMSEEDLPGKIPDEPPYDPNNPINRGGNPGDQIRVNPGEVGRILDPGQTHDAPVPEDTLNVDRGNKRVPDSEWVNPNPWTGPLPPSNRPWPNGEPWQEPDPRLNNPENWARLPTPLVPVPPSQMPSWTQQPGLTTPRIPAVPGVNIQPFPATSPVTTVTPAPALAGGPGGALPGAPNFGVLPFDPTPNPNNPGSPFWHTPFGSGLLDFLNNPFGPDKIPPAQAAPPETGAPLSGGIHSGIINPEDTGSSGGGGDWGYNPDDPNDPANQKLWPGLRPNPLLGFPGGPGIVGGPGAFTGGLYPWQLLNPGGGGGGSGGGSGGSGG